LIDQEKIHNQCLSKDPEERVEGLKQLETNFPLLPDKADLPQMSPQK